MDERDIAVYLLGASGITILFLYLMGGVLADISPIIPTFLFIVGLIIPPASVAIYKYGYWLLPFFKGQRTIRTTEADIEIPPSNDVIVKREGGKYYASMFLGVKIYKTTTAMSPVEKMGFMNLWEKTVSGIKSVTKYGVLVYITDLSKYKQSIENRKAKAQMALGEERTKPNPDKNRIDVLEREIAMWDNIMERVTKGAKPINTLTFVQITAEGVTRDGAIAAVRTEANKARAAISTTLNVEVSLLTGEDMKRCFDWSCSLPPGLKEL